MNVTKVSVAALFAASLVLVVLLRHRSSTSLRLTSKGKNLMKNSWEYYQGLPLRLAADYYPQKETHVDVIKEPTALNKGSGIFSATFLVKSSPRNYSRRKVIRTTWGSILSYRDVSLHLMFIMGTTDNSNEQDRLNIESEKYGDILQVNVSDVFPYSPKKFLSAFRWIRTHPTLLSEFYISTEDDCIVNIAATINFLVDHQNDVIKSIHCGYMLENNTGVIRGHGPRSVSKETYPKSVYPAFCRGKLVIIAQSYINKIHDASMVTNITGFRLDDILLYGILREKLEIENSIKNVLNGGFPLVFSPYDNTDKAISKMLRKWVGWKREVDAVIGGIPDPK